jgi:copper chaperone CopZ
MHCVGCAMVIDDAVEELPGVKSATTNYARQIAEVEYDESQVTEEEITAAIQAANYSATLLDREQQ